MTAADSIYTARTLHSLPHRWRVRQVIRTLKKFAVPGVTYADVGCGDGFVTTQIAMALQCSRCVGYDFNPEVLEFAQQRHPEIDFRRWNVVNEPPSSGKYSIVTCLETLEHVSDIRSALKKLVSITILGRETFSSEHEGSRFDYFRRLLSGQPISHFRKHPENGHWKLHTGFDYREIDRILQEEGFPLIACNYNWNRFYQLASAPTRSNGQSDADTERHGTSATESGRQWKRENSSAGLTSLALAEDR